MKLFRAEEAFRIAVIALMMGALARAAGELAARVVQGFDPTLLAALALLVCLEGIATDRLARQLAEASERWRLHLAEWAVIVAALRLALSLSRGTSALAAEAARWLAQPRTLLDGGLLLGALLLGTVWWLGTRMSRCLEALGPEADAPPPPPADTAAYYAWLTRPHDEQPGEAWVRLRQLVVAGSVLLLLLSGLARLDLRLALSLRHPAIAGIVGNALLYYGLGYVLLALGRYALLRGRWRRQEVPVTASLARRWALLALIFALGVALAALLLPLRPSLALLAVAVDVLRAAAVFLEQLALLVVAALGYLLNLLFSLLNLGGAEAGPAPAPTSVPQPTPQPAMQPVAWWPALQALTLWAALLGWLGYALVHFVRDRRQLWSLLAARGGPLAWLARLGIALWRWLAGRGHDLGARWRSLVARGPSRPPAPSPRRQAWPRPRTARERVRLLYLLGLQEAARLAHPRRPADTPGEYAERVGPMIGAGREDLEALTAGFVEARYGRREFTPPEVNPFRAAYRRLRQALRRVR